MELRPEDVQEILKVFAESELEELRLEIGGTRLQVSKKQSSLTEQPSAVTPSAARVAPAAEATAEISPPPQPQGDDPKRELARVDVVADATITELRSPLLGVFYRRPAPDQPAFVEVGDDVHAGDAVCIIDVMKMFTSVPAATDGRIVEVCVEDGQLVEFDQVLMRIEPR